MERNDVQDETRRLFSPTMRRLIRSYGLLVLIAIAFLLMALLVREKDRTVPAQSSASQMITVATLR